MATFGRISSGDRASDSGSRLPIPKLSAIQPAVIVVSVRSRTANATFAGSPLGRDLRAALFQEPTPFTTICLPPFLEWHGPGGQRLASASVCVHQIGGELDKRRTLA